MVRDGTMASTTYRQSWRPTWPPATQHAVAETGCEFAQVQCPPAYLANSRGRRGDLMHAVVRRRADATNDVDGITTVLSDGDATIMSSASSGVDHRKSSQTGQLHLICGAIRSSTRQMHHQHHLHPDVVPCFTAPRTLRPTTTKHKKEVHQYLCHCTSPCRSLLCRVTPRG
jgi:hypothetical protein